MEEVGEEEGEDDDDGDGGDVDGTGADDVKSSGGLVNFDNCLVGTRMAERC
jgi:hypothetical protein